jgi:hypothetical protein
MIINHWHSLKNFQTRVPDTEAPTDPSSLQTSNITATEITLSWAASTDNVAVTGYDMLLNGSLVTTVTGTSYTYTGLTASTTYTLGVRAKDAAGNTSNLITIQGTTSAAATNIQFVKSDYFFSPSTSTSSVTITGIQSGDFVLVVSGDNAGSAPVRDPSGTTQIASTTGNVTSRVSYIFSTGTSITLTHQPPSGASNWGSLVAVYRNVNQTTPLDVTPPSAYNSLGTTTSTPCPSITTTTNDAMVLAILVMEDTTDPRSSITIPSGYTQDASGYDSTSDTAKVVTSKIVATAGTENPGSFTHLSDDSHGYTIALRKA